MTLNEHAPMSKSASEVWVWAKKHPRSWMNFKNCMKIGTFSSVWETGSSISVARISMVLECAGTAVTIFRLMCPPWSIWRSECLFCLSRFDCYWMFRFSWVTLICLGLLNSGHFSLLGCGCLSLMGCSYFTSCNTYSSPTYYFGDEQFTEILFYAVCLMSSLSIYAFWSWQTFIFSDVHFSHYSTQTVQFTRVSRGSVVVRKHSFCASGRGSIPTTTTWWRCWACLLKSQTCSTIPRCKIGTSINIGRTGIVHCYEWPCDLITSMW